MTQELAKTKTLARVNQALQDDQVKKLVAWGWTLDNVEFFGYRLAAVRLHKIDWHPRVNMHVRTNHSQHVEV